MFELSFSFRQLNPYDFSTITRLGTSITLKFQTCWVPRSPASSCWLPAGKETVETILL